MGECAQSNSYRKERNEMKRLFFKINLLAILMLAMLLLALASASAINAAAAPQQFEPDVTATRVGDDIQLAWPAVPGATSYEIWRDTTPYFTAPDPTHPEKLLDTLTPAGDMTYRDSYNNLDNVPYDTYYIVVAYVGGTAYPSNTASGEFEFELKDGSNPTTITVSGKVIFADGGAVAGAQVQASASPTVSTTTGADGSFSVDVGPADLPAEVRVQVSYTAPSGRIATTTAYLTAESATLDAGNLNIPNPDKNVLTDMGSGVFEDADSDIHVETPAEVSSLAAAAYMADTAPNLYPGNLGDDAGNPFNNTQFIYFSALDSSGAPVTTLSTPATVRVLIPTAQWPDLDDMTPGNGQIDIPIYAFNETTGQWESEAGGHLVSDATGTLIPESDIAAIRSKTYSGDVYGEFTAQHFSWWNIDYPPRAALPDFGDAPDPSFPSLLANMGVHHLDPHHIWLGASVDGEPDSNQVDADIFDDGVMSFDPFTVRANNWDWPGPMYLNVLVDLNDNGSWADAGEWMIQNYTFSLPFRRGKLIDTGISIPSGHWTRVTLTGQALFNYIGHGEYPLGETEDYDGDIPVNLTVSISGMGDVNITPPDFDCDEWCVKIYPRGALVQLTALPDPGETFLGWGGACSEWGVNPTCVLLLDEDKSVNATFSQPPVEEYPHFSLTPGSPTLTANGWGPADILRLNPSSGGSSPPSLSKEYDAIADLGLVAGDDIDAFSFGNGLISGQWVYSPFNFSTRPGAVGLPGTELAEEALCNPAEVAGDEFSIVGDFSEGGPYINAQRPDEEGGPYINAQRLDEDGAACTTNRGNALLLVVGDDIDALDQLDPGGGPATADSAKRPTDTPLPVYFSLAPGSPSLTAMGASPADILMVTPGSGNPPTIYASAAFLGLQPTDDIDALSLYTEPPTTLAEPNSTIPPPIIFSLAAGSPTLTNLGLSPADVLTPNSPQAAFTALDGGLDPADDIDAFKADPWWIMSGGE